MDLALIIDNSGSIRDKNVKNATNHTVVDHYQTLKDFINSLLDIMDVGPLNTRVGALQFSHKSHVVFHLNTYSTKAQMKDAINRMTLIGSTTNTSGGIRLGRLGIFNPYEGDRPDQPNVMIVITDGESNVAQNETIREAEIAKNAGITIFVVGVTQKINETELKAIASDPDRDHYFNSTSIANLFTIKNKLLKHVCHEDVITASLQQRAKREYTPDIFHQTM